MKPILGPFVLDPNISVAVLSFDDQLWVVLRRALRDDQAEPYGVLRFLDVRACRSRHRAHGTPPDLDQVTAARCWALEVSDSAFLTDTIRSDLQRTMEAYAGHKHFVVIDGNDRAVDVIAREVLAHALLGPIALNFQELMEQDDAGNLSNEVRLGAPER